MNVTSLFSRFLPGGTSASSASAAVSIASATPSHGRPRHNAADTLDAALRLDRFHRAWSSLLSAGHAAINAPKGLDPPLSTVADPLATVTRTLLADTAAHGHVLGPCLDYVFAHHVLATLVDTAASDQPLGFFALALDALVFLVHAWPAKLIVAHPPIHLALRRAFTHALANRSRLARVYPDSLLALVAGVSDKLASAPELVHILIHDRRRYSTQSTGSAAMAVPAASPIPGAMTLSMSTSSATTTSPRMKRSTSLTFPSPTMLSSSPTSVSVTTAGRITSPHTPARPSTASRSAASTSSTHRTQHHSLHSTTDPGALDFPLLDTLLAHIHLTSLSGTLARLTLALLLDHACGPALRTVLTPPAPEGAPFLDAIPAALCALFTQSSSSVNAGDANALDEVTRWVAHVTRSCPSPSLVARMLERIQRGFLQAVVAPQLTVDVAPAQAAPEEEWARVWAAAAKMERVVRSMRSREGDAGPLARVVVEALLVPPLQVRGPGENGSLISTAAADRHKSIEWLADVEAGIEARANDAGGSMVRELRASGLTKVLSFGSLALDPLADGTVAGAAADGGTDPCPRSTLMSELERVFAGETSAERGSSAQANAPEKGDDKLHLACASLVLALIECHPTHALPWLVPSLVPLPPAISAANLPRQPSDTSLSSSSPLLSQLASSTQPLPISAATVLSTSPPLVSSSSNRLTTAQSSLHSMSRYESIPALFDFPLSFVLPPRPATAPPALSAEDLTRMFRRLARVVEIRAQALGRFTKKSPIARQPSLRNLLGGGGGSGGQDKACDKAADRFRMYLVEAEHAVAQAAPWTSERGQANGESSIRSVSTYYTARTEVWGGSEWSVRSLAPGESSVSQPTVASRSSVRPAIMSPSANVEQASDDDNFLLPSSSIRDEPSTPGPSETLSFDQFLKSAAVDIIPPSPTAASTSPLDAAIVPPVTPPHSLADPAFTSFSPSYSPRSWPWRRRAPPSSTTPSSGPPPLASLFVPPDTPSTSLASSPLSPTSPTSSHHQHGSRPPLPADAFLQLVIVALSQWHVNPPSVNWLITGMLTGMLQASAVVTVDGGEVYHRELAHVVLDWSLYVLEGGSGAVVNWDDEEGGMSERAWRLVRRGKERERLGDKKWREENERIMAEWAAEVAATAVVVVGRWERVSSGL